MKPLCGHLDGGLPASGAERPPTVGPNAQRWVEVHEEEQRQGGCGQARREGGWHGGGCGRPQGPAGGLCFCAVLWARESSFRKTVRTVVSVWCPAQGRLSLPPASHRPREDQAHAADSTAFGAGSLSGAQAAPTPRCQ